MSLQLSSKNVQLRLLDTRRRNFRRSLRGMEQLESRQLLAGNLSLAGTAFVDTNNDGTLNTGEAYLPDAEIDLFSGDGMTQLGMTHTDAQGAYRFDNLEPGNYQLLNRSALGFEATATQVLSTINPAGADPLDGSELIDVTLMDPADLQASIDFDRFFSPSWGLERGPMTVQIDGFQGGLYSGALPLTLHSTALSPNPSSEIQSLCIDLFHDPVSNVNYPVVPGAQPLGSGSPHNAGRIAYLYNHYGQTPQGTTPDERADNAAALQFAVWELIYDGDTAPDPTSDLHSGNFLIVNRTSDAVINKANQYLAESYGKSEAATFLNFLPPSGASQSGQGVIVTGSFNFANQPSGSHNTDLVVSIVKSVNGDDANSAPGPHVAAGSVLSFDYNVTNTGRPLTGVQVTDDNATPLDSSDDFSPLPVLSGGFNTGDINHNGIFDTGETWHFADSAHTAPMVGGQYHNTAVATGIDASVTPPATFSSSDVAYYFVDTPSISLVKLTNGTDNDTGTGPIVAVGSTVTWTYNVTNTGNVPLSNVVVKDDNGTPGNTADDFTVGTIATLAAGASATLTATGIAQPGQYANVGSVTGSDANGTGQTVTASNPDHYFGYTVGVSLVKLTNGTDNNTGTGPNVLVGDTVSWTYTVTNTGNVTLNNVIVKDDNGTPGDTTDDFQVGTIANLAPGVSATLTATGTAQEGQYTNYGTATGTPVDNNSHPLTAPISASDVDHYFGLALSTLSGFVWLDSNNNGAVDMGEPFIPGVTVTLTGTNDKGSVTGTATTDANGMYVFENLRPGTYKLMETQPGSYADGKDVVGTINDIAVGQLVANDQIGNIQLRADRDGINYDFGELPLATSPVHQGQAATIGFWHNKNGQALLTSLNGGSISTALGNWMATSFPNMFGASAGASNLTGKTNAQIAKLYLDTRFSVKGQKLDAQVMAVAFAVYATDSDLAGSAAVSYGFQVTTTGLGAATFNVGSNGAAFGVANNTVLTVMQILSKTNDRAYKGVLWDLDHSVTISAYEQTLRDLANIIYTKINETGDIA